MTEPSNQLRPKRKVALCFFLSGLSSLMYETAWVEEFSLLFGTSELAVSIILASFMGGLALGAYVLSRWRKPIHKPIKVYAILELLIGLWALALPWLLAVSKKVYANLFLSYEQLDLSFGNYLFNLATAMFLIIPPTAMMGATLPLLATIKDSQNGQGQKSIATLYGLNTLGAAAGCGLTTFFLLPKLHLVWTTYIAVAINVLVFLIIFQEKWSVKPNRSPVKRLNLHPVLLIVFAVGLLTFSSEVFWVRLLSHPLGSSVFSFGTMLITYLVGIGSGALCTRPFLKTKSASSSILVLGIFGFGAWITLYFQVDNAFFSHFLGGENTILDWQKRVFISIISLFPCSFFAGMVIPAAIGFLAEGNNLSPRTGQILAFNTLGNIAGALVTGFYLLPHFKFEGVINFLTIGAMVLCTVCILLRFAWNRAWTIIPATFLILIWIRPFYEPIAILKSSLFSGKGIQGEVFYMGVGLTSTVMIAKQPMGWRLSSTGLPESLFVPKEQILDLLINTKWMTALPALANPKAQNMLIVGLGGGANLESITQQWKRIDVVEIEKEMIAANKAMDQYLGQNRFEDPRLRFIVQDARQVLELTRKQYDAIISQPSHPWTGGAAHLYTKEFFQVVKDALRPNGVFCQWMGLSFVDKSLLRDLIFTLEESFAYVQIFEPEKGAFLFLCSDSAYHFSLEHLSPQDRQRLMDFGINRVERILAAKVEVTLEKGEFILDRRNPFKTQFLRALKSNGQLYQPSTISEPQFQTHDPLWLEYETIMLHRPAPNTWFQRAQEVQKQTRYWQEWVKRQNWEKLHPTQKATITKQIIQSQMENSELVEGKDPLTQALVLGYQALRRGELSTIKGLEETLVKCDRESALFPEAAILRILWRLQEENSQHHQDAHQILRKLRGHQLNKQALALQWLLARKLDHEVWEKSAWHALRQKRPSLHSREELETELILSLFATK